MQTKATGGKSFKIDPKPVVFSQETTASGEISSTSTWPALIAAMVAARFGAVRLVCKHCAFKKCGTPCT